MNMSRFVNLLVALTLSTAGLFGQAEIGGATVGGTVSDPSGASVPGAKVTLSSPDTGFTRAVETTGAGLFSFGRVPVGRYELTVEANGFKTGKRQNLTLTVGAVLDLDFKLEIGAASETVSVTAEVPVVESTRSQTSTTVNEKAIRDLPINGRNFLDFALLTPGITRDPRGGDLSFGGQRGTANSLLVDGGDSNNLFFGQSSGRAGTRNPYSFSQDAVQEFQVNTSGYTAETGRAGGGVINVVTKNGTNDFHGTAFWFFRDRAMNANTFINNSRRIARQPYHFNQFGANLGGPLVKDKVFFFFNYDAQRNKNPNELFLTQAPTADPLSQQGFRELQQFLTPYTRNFDNNLYTGRVDWNLTSTQNLNVRYNAHRFQGKNLENAGANSAAEHTGNSNVTTDNVAVNYTKVFGSATVFDARYIFLRDNEPGQANSTNPEAVILQNNATVMQIGRNNFSPRFTNTRRNQMIASVSRVAGRHTFKAGVDFNFERIDNFFPGLFSGSYRFLSYADFAARRPFSYTQAFAGANTSGPLTKPNINEYAFYLQDVWRVNQRLTLNYGIRYDLMDSADPAVRNPNAPLLGAGLDTARMNLDSNNWGPRFGFAYRLLANEKLVARGGYGVFYARTPAIMTGTAHSQNGIQVQTFELRANLPTYPNVLAAAPTGTVTPNIYVFAPDYVQPLTQQWSFTLASQILPGTALEVGYLGVRGMHLSRTRDVNLFPAELVNGTLSTGGAVPFFRHPGTGGPARPNPAFGRISVFESGADSVYHGMYVQVTKRYARNFQLLGSYTWSKVIDTAPNQVAVVVPFDDGLMTQNSLNPNADRGLGDADVRHRFIFSGLWDITYANKLGGVGRAILGDWQLSLIANAQSGRFFTATVAGDPNNNSQTATDRTPWLARNTIEGPGFAAVDARVSKDILLGTERVRLRLIGEAFNLTNRANFNNFNRGQFNFNATSRVFTPNAPFLQRTGSADPRILQIAARITF